MENNDPAEEKTKLKTKISDMKKFTPSKWVKRECAHPTRKLAS